VETASLFALGMRRLAADLALIRLLVYYGTPEEPQEAPEPRPHEPFHPEHPERYWAGGRYPELGPRALRILDIDPFFSYAALYSAGALAFNVGRPEEALDLLRYALSRDPANVQYQATAAAIGFYRKGESESVIRLLGPLVESPDCPTMIKNMVAFLYKRSGRREKAIRLYREILEVSRDPGYREIARRNLRELIP